MWVPNALLAEGLRVLEAWGFEYKTMIVWAKRRKDGGPDGRGVGFYFRNTTEAVLFGTKGRLRTLNPGRRQVNIIDTMRREHSRKPDELYDIIESCSPASYLELFARYPRDGWTSWGNEAGDTVVPRGKQHANFRGAKISRVTNLVPLLEAGLLSPHQNLVLRKRGGAEYGAKVLADGSIELDSGGVFSSPTDAAKAAGGYVSTDGWIRWRDRESDLTLATLRDKLSLEV